MTIDMTAKEKLRLIRKLLRHYNEESQELVQEYKLVRKD